MAKTKRIAGFTLGIGADISDLSSGLDQARDKVTKFLGWVKAAQTAASMVKTADSFIMGLKEDISTMSKAMQEARDRQEGLFEGMISGYQRARATVLSFWEEYKAQALNTFRTIDRALERFWDKLWGRKPSAAAGGRNRNMGPVRSISDFERMAAEGFDTQANIDESYNEWVRSRGRQLPAGQTMGPPVPGSGQRGGGFFDTERQRLAKEIQRLRNKPLDRFRSQGFQSPVDLGMSGAGYGTRERRQIEARREAFDRTQELRRAWQKEQKQLEEKHHAEAQKKRQKQIESLQIQSAALSKMADSLQIEDVLGG